jgi:hypothetical protein
MMEHLQGMAMFKWLKRNPEIKIPPEIEQEIFDMCRGHCSEDRLERLKFFISTYSMERIDCLLSREDLNPLMEAMDRRTENVARLMFASGSDLSIRTSLGYSVLLAATQDAAYLDILRSCLVAGGDPNERMGNEHIGFLNTALGLSILYGNIDAVKLLFDFGANYAEQKDMALFMWAQGSTRIRMQHDANPEESFISREAILKELLKAGADINGRTGGEGCTLIQHCMYWCGLNGLLVTRQSLKILLRNGANPDLVGRLVGSDGTTVLHNCRSFDAIRLLLEIGVELEPLIDKWFSDMEIFNLVTLDGSYYGELDFLLKRNYKQIEVDPNGKMPNLNITYERRTNYVSDEEYHLRKFLSQKDRLGQEKLLEIVNRMILYIP